MEETESQIAKIQLGGGKSANSYTFVMAEKADYGTAEIYVIAELPLLPPAAEESCERICMAIGASLKRSYKRFAGEDAFENAIGQVNEELAKLAGLGQTSWVDKLNCILSVKDGNSFSIATSGKVAAFLVRSGELTDISCSQTQSHPLKTFENFAVGKIRLGDLLLLSTTQLFNYLSPDLLLSLINNNNFFTATQSIIKTLKANAEPQVSFAVLMNLQVPMGQPSEPDSDLESYLESSPAAPSLVSKVWQWVTTAFKFSPSSLRPSISATRPAFFTLEAWRNFFSRAKNFWQVTRTSAQSARESVKIENLRQLSPQKKFFLISAGVLLLAAVINIAVAVHLKNTRQKQNTISAELKTAAQALSNAQASILYKDDVGAANYFQIAKQNLPDPKLITSSNQDAYNKLLKQLEDTKKIMEKVVEPKVTNLGSLAAANRLIKLPQYLAAQVKTSIVSYNKTTGQVNDNALSSPVNILASAYSKDSVAAIYNGSSLYLWDFSSGKLLGPGFSQNVPAESDFAGMAEYPVNSRIYVADRKAATVVSFAPTKDSLSKPVIAAKDSSINQAIDMAIDGSIYVLTKTGLSKFQSGRLADFSLPALPTAFSGSGKISTEKDFNYIYILDAGNNRILILDKRGGLVNTLKSSSFSDLKDFQVDEKNKQMFVLNGSSLLKVSLP